MYPDLSVSGLHMDMVSAVAGRLNIHILVLALPWKRALSMIKKGEADAITYMGKTPERMTFALFYEGNTLSQVQNGFFTLKSRAHEFDFNGDLTPLKGLTIGTLAGYNYGPALDRATFLWKDAGALNERQLIRKLLNHRFDVGLGFVSRRQYQAQKMRVADQLVFLKPYIESIPQYIAFSRKSPHAHLAKPFADEMALFKLSWEYRALLALYGLNE